MQENCSLQLIKQTYKKKASIRGPVRHQSCATNILFWEWIVLRMLLFWEQAMSNLFGNVLSELFLTSRFITVMFGDIFEFEYIVKYSYIHDGFLYPTNHVIEYHFSARPTATLIRCWVAKEKWDIERVEWKKMVWFEYKFFHLHNRNIGFDKICLPKTTWYWRWQDAIQVKRIKSWIWRKCNHNSIRKWVL